MSVVKHTSYNLLGTIVPILVSLATVPLYLSIVGIERFGVLSICWLLLGYFGLFDLGLGRAISQRLAALAERSGQERSDVFWAGLFLSMAIGAVGTILLIPGARAALGLLRFDSPQVAAEVADAIPWLAATLPLTLITGILSGALVGRERFGAVNAIEGLSNSLLMIAPLLFAWWMGPTLANLIAACLWSRLLCALLFLASCRAAVPLLRPTRPSATVAKDLLGYGGWVSVTGIVGPILSLWDRFAVGAVLGTIAVSIYVIPFTLVLRLVLVPAALSRALFPKFAGASQDRARTLAVEGVAALAVVMTPLALLLMIVIGPFLSVWVGPALAAQSVRVAYILIPGIWLNGFALIALNLLHARGRPKVAAWIHLAETIPYIVLLYLCMIFLGLEGTALIWTVRVSVDAVLMFHFSAAGLRPLARLLPEAVVLAAAAIAALLLPPDSPWHWIVLTGLLAAGATFAYRGAPQAARLRLRQLRARLLRTAA